MPTLDRDLEQMNRTTDLRRYAQELGYKERPADSLPGITLLEHPRLGDCVAMARLARGDIYARVRSDELKRSPGDSDEQAHSRLRDAITRSADTGMASDFVQSARRQLGHEPWSRERIAEHLRGWNEAQCALRPEPPDAPRLPPRNLEPASAAERLRRWQRDSEELAERTKVPFASSRGLARETGLEKLRPDRRLQGDELAPNERARFQDGLSRGIEQAAQKRPREVLPAVPLPIPGRGRGLDRG